MLKLKKIEPLLNHIVTTANIYEDTQSDGNILTEESKDGGEFKEYQTVVAVGPNVTSVKPGDVVVISAKAYAMPQHTPVEDKLTGLMTGDKVEMVVRFPIININGTPHLFLYDRDVEFIVRDYEVVEEDNLESKVNII